MYEILGNTKNFEQASLKVALKVYKSCGGRIAFLHKEIWLASTDRRHS
jgi:hypothetical protein